MRFGKMEVEMKSKLCRLGVFYLASAMLLVLLAACASPPEETPPSAITVTDQLGRTVRLEEVPKRIISLAPSNTEILFALGLADRIVAVTDYCNYPPQAEEKPSVGGFSTPNIEEIVAHSPDLILATSIHEKRVLPKLEDKRLVVFALNPKTIDEVLEAITLVGKITGSEAEASRLVGEMQRRIKAVADRVSGLSEEQKPRSFYLLWHAPMMTSGSGTLQNDLIVKAGGMNIAKNISGYADISLEAVIVSNPEVMVAGAGHGSGEDLTFQFIQTETRLSSVSARINNRLHAIDADLASRGGPRIVDALEQFAAFIHLELFK